MIVGVDAATWRRGVRRARICIARLAITSLAFMLVLVPLPVWKTSTGKCSSSLPSATSPAAAMIAAAVRALQPAGLVVHARGGGLDQPIAAMNSPRHRPARDREILHRPLGLGTVQGVGGHLHLAERVALRAFGSHGLLLSLNRKDYRPAPGRNDGAARPGACHFCGTGILAGVLHATQRAGAMLPHAVRGSMSPTTDRVEPQKPCFPTAGSMAPDRRGPARQAVGLMQQLTRQTHAGGLGAGRPPNSCHSSDAHPTDRAATIAIPIAPAGS